MNYEKGIDNQVIDRCEQADEPDGKKLSRFTLNSLQAHKL